MSCDAPYTCFGVGFKAFNFLANMINRRNPPNRIVAYRQPDDQSAAFDKIKKISIDHNILFEENKRPKIMSAETVFCVGWQFMLDPTDAVDANVIVFHDSLLPKYRGFAPTVTALINGEKEIGVTALRPVNDLDAGPIIGQQTIPIEYPIKIKDALEKQVDAMADLAYDILPALANDKVTFSEQDERKATYSIWRDKEDYRLNWTESADRVVRTVDALGDPYDGARAIFGGEEIVIEDAKALPNLAFEIRQPGKIWALRSGAPVVVCGEGAVLIKRARRLNGEIVSFSRLRERFQ